MWFWLLQWNRPSIGQGGAAASPEMAYSPLREATVMAEAFPMLSTGPSPTWLLKLRTCQPITLASCCTACTWCCDIWNEARRHTPPAPGNGSGSDGPYLREEEVLQLLLLVRQRDDPAVPVHHSDLLHADVQLQLDGPACRAATVTVATQRRTAPTMPETQTESQSLR